MRLELGQPRPGGNRGIDRETLLLSLSVAGAVIDSKGTSGWFEDELLDILKALPKGMYFRSCFTCAFSDYSPAGNRLFGDLACFRDNKENYRQVSSKQELLALWDSKTEFVQETHLCSAYERRQPGVGYRG
jgi:hypothetical protein